MARKSKRIIQAEINHLRRLLEDKDHDWTDKEIIDKLKISPATLYRHKNTIDKEIKEEWQKQSERAKEEWNKLRFGPLEQRALDILAAMEQSQKVVEEIRDADETPEAVRLEAAKWAVKFRVNIYYLLERGPLPNMKALLYDKQQVEQLEKRRIIA